MKHLRLMQFISRTTGYRIGIHRGKSEYYYLVDSITGAKYRPWVGIATTILSGLLGTVAIFSVVATIGTLAEYEAFGFWTLPIVSGFGVWTYFSTIGARKMHGMFERRPEELTEDYEPSEEELKDWENWVH